jgi:hypothetical protein
MGGIEAYLLRDCSDCIVVLEGVVEYKVANSTRADAKFTRVSTHQLRQRNRQINELAIAVDVMSNNP